MANRMNGGLERGPISTRTGFDGPDEHSRLLIATIEALDHALAVFEGDGKFVHCTESFREFNSSVSQTLSLDGSLENYLKALLAKGLVREARGNEKAWLRQHMEWDDRVSRRPFELLGDDGSSMLFERKRLPGGK